VEDKVTGVAKKSPAQETLASQLKRMAQDRPSLDVAQFRFIGLDKIQAAYGGSWPIHRDHIRSAAQDHILQRLRPDDLLARSGDGFLLVFGSLSGREAEVEALSLAHSLNDFFLARTSNATMPLEIDVETRAVPMKILATTLDRADVRSPPDDVIAISAPHPAEIEWRFQPDWDVRGEAIVGYSGVTVHRQTGERLAGYQFDPPPGRLPSLAAIDAATLQACDDAARRLFAVGKRARISTPVHITSLTNPTARTQLLQALEMTDRDIVRFRVVRVAGVTPGFPRMYLDEALNPVRRVVPNVALSTVWNEPDLSSLMQVNVQAIGFSLSSSATLPALQPSLLARVRAAVGLAHAARKPFFIEGAVTPELAVQLGAIGVDNISSHIIWPTVAEPDGVMKWSAGRLTQR
jgi:hypothetical protein